MSKNWPKDIRKMHKKYKVHRAVKDMDDETLRNLLKFRISFIEEEFLELKYATKAEDIVDALIDITVVAIGTLDLFGVDMHKAWNEVHTANMNKQVGIKESRPNPLGLPDLIKPTGWTAPSHEGNHGLLSRL